MARKAAKKKKLEVNIREMKEEDIKAVLAIDRKITGQDRALTYTLIPMSFLGGQLAMSVVAEVEGKIVGFLFGQMVGSNYELGDIAVAQIIGVDPDYLHQRIGTRLVEAFMAFCKKQGIDKVHAMLSVHDWWMISFLRSMNFSHGEMVDFVKSSD